MACLFTKGFIQCHICKRDLDLFFSPEIASKYTTYRLQLKLQKHFGESLVVETQQGQEASKLVYSSSVSIV